MYTFISFSRRPRLVTVLLVLGLAISATTGRATAQEKTGKTHEKDDGMYHVEVKDGKLYVDGEMVKELGDKDKGVFFSTGDGEEGHGYAVFSDDDDEPGPGIHAKRFRFRMPGGKAWMLDTDDEDIDVDVPGMFGFRSMDGDVEFFGDMDGEYNALFDNGSRPMRKRLEILREMGGPGGMFSEDSREIARMEHQAHKLAREVRMADGSDRKELEKKLHDLLGDIFERKLALQKKQVKQMTEELSRLNRRVDERSRSRDSIIERRFNELLGKHDVMEW